jgi:AraC family transcriptional activator of pobA
MKRECIEPLAITSITEFCRLMELPPPEHPLVSVIRFSPIRPARTTLPPAMVLPFFSVRFDEGLMSFFLPGQVLSSDAEGGMKQCGWWLLIHPDLLWNYSIARNIRQYGLFANAVNAALRLAGKEEQLIAGILQNIEQEYLPPRAALSQEAILSQVEMLLIHAERFYKQQRIIPKDLL